MRSQRVSVPHPSREERRTARRDDRGAPWAIADRHLTLAPVVIAGLR